jgi:pyrimidine deaminase RibD-like protein
MTDRDTVYMRRALELARLGRGLVSPNPMVGSVIVQDDRIVGEGYHRYDRLLHAESYALEEAGDLSRGAVLYCTLEPCCHFGRTPPCSDAIIAAGISRAVVAITDPDPRVNGEGLRRLDQAGVAIRVGLCSDEATRLNEIYLKHTTVRMPFVHRIEAGPEPNILDRWRPSRAFLDRAVEYDGMILLGAGPWASSVLSHSLKKARHRALVVAGPQDVITALGKSAGELDVLWTPLPPAEIDDAVSLFDHLSSLRVTSALVFACNQRFPAAASDPDRLTVVTGRDDSGSEIDVEHQLVDELADVVEVTGYPRQARIAR